jgi:hypothetical protein
LGLIETLLLFALSLDDFVEVVFFGLDFGLGSLRHGEDRVLTHSLLQDLVLLRSELRLLILALLLHLDALLLILLLLDLELLVAHRGMLLDNDLAAFVLQLLFEGFAFIDCLLLLLRGLLLLRPSRCCHFVLVKEILQEIVFLLLAAAPRTLSGCLLFYLLPHNLYKIKLIIKDCSHLVHLLRRLFHHLLATCLLLRIWQSTPACRVLGCAPDVLWSPLV